MKEINFLKPSDNLSKMFREFGWTAQEIRGVIGRAFLLPTKNPKLILVIDNENHGIGRDEN